MDHKSDAHQRPTSTHAERDSSGNQCAFSEPVMPRSSPLLLLEPHSTDYIDFLSPSSGVPDATSSTKNVQPDAAAEMNEDAHAGARILCQLSHEARGGNFSPLAGAATGADQFNAISSTRNYSAVLLTPARQSAASFRSTDFIESDPDETDDPDTGDLEQPTSPTMSGKREGWTEKELSNDADNRLEFQSHLERRHYVDRSMTTLLSTAELASRIDQMNNHPMAAQFKRLHDKAEARSQPSPGRMRVESDPEVIRKQRIMDRAIGYPGGPPQDKELAENYLNRSMEYLARQNQLLHAHWPQQEAAKKELERMRRGFIPGSEEELIAASKKRDAAKQWGPQKPKTDSSRHADGPDSLDEGPRQGLVATGTRKYSNQPPPKPVRALSLPRSAIFAFNGTPEKTPVLGEGLQSQAWSSPTKFDTNGATKKRKQPEVDNKILDSNLGGYWEPRVDASGSRPKKKPLKDMRD